MRTITNCLQGSVKKINPRLLSLFTFWSIAGLLFSSNIFAQIFPTSCTSKDLTLLQASLPAPAGNRCLCSGDRILVLGIHNGTGSIRTSFALWGTLIRESAAGDTIERKSIFACAGPIPKNGDYFLNATTLIINGEVVPNGTGGYPTIHVDCGQSLDIVDMHLAWTSANGNETCDVLYANPGTINPKCGTQDLIRVDLGVNADLITNIATCTTGGSIKVSPNGGIAPYQVCLYKKNSASDSTLISCQSVAANAFYTFTGLAAGDYTARVTDNMNETDVTKRCFNNKFATVGSSTAPTAVATGDLITCAHTTASLSGTGSSTGGNISYLWSGPAAVTNNSTISGSTITGGTYTLKVTNSTNGCTAAATASVSVNITAPTANAAGDLLTCSHTTAALSGSGSSTGAGISYLWTGSGSITNSTSISASTTAGGSYTLKVTDGGNGCTATATASVSMNTSAPTAQAAGGTITCANATSALTGTGSSTGAVTYLWTGPGAITGSTSINATTQTGGVYTLKVTNTGNGCTAAATASVSTNTTAPSFTVCFVQPTLCAGANSGGQVTINASGGTDFMYKLNSGSPQSGNVFSNLGAGSITSITVSNAAGCSTTVNCGDLVINCVAGGITQKEPSIRNELAIVESQPTVKAYPNPFNDRVKFVVNSPATGNGSLEVYNVMGQKIKTVFQGRINSGDQSFELTIPKKQQSTLIYIFRVGDKQVTGKLLQLNN